MTKRAQLECETFNCQAAGEVIYTSEDVPIITGPFHEGDRKEGFPILCDKCGCEANEMPIED